MDEIDEKELQAGTSGTSGQSSTEHTKSPHQLIKDSLKEITTRLTAESADKVTVSKDPESPRPDKKLVVLDIDLTIYDSSEEGRQQGQRAIRPHLHQFLESVYADYDIIIWSATNRYTIDCKLKLLGITNNNHYKILSCMDRSHMTSVPWATHIIEVKPLAIIWEKYKQYNRKNSVICDDQDLNFLLNKNNGILVDRYSYLNYKYDKELLHLAKYLKRLYSSKDFSQITHSGWRKCVTE